MKFGEVDGVVIAPLPRKGLVDMIVANTEENVVDEEEGDTGVCVTWGRRIPSGWGSPARSTAMNAEALVEATTPRRVERRMRAGARGTPTRVQLYPQYRLARNCIVFKKPFFLKAASF